VRLGFLILFGLIGFAQQDTPAPITSDQKIEVLELTKEAYIALNKFQDARARELQAQLDKKDAQRELDEANKKISTKMKEIRELCRANEVFYDVTDNFEWIKKSTK
jgi:hypothetical protein